MEVVENALERAGGQDLAQRMASLNRIALSAARGAARALATDSRFEIPQLQRTHYTDISDADVDALSDCPFSLMMLSGISEAHTKNPAKNPLPIDCEIIRRTIVIARDLTVVSWTAPRALLGMSVEDVARIKKLTDDDAEAMSVSSRVAIIPRIPPEEKLRSQDGAGWDGPALLRRFVVECDQLGRSA